MTDQGKQDDDRSSSSRPDGSGGGGKGPAPPPPVKLSRGLMSWVMILGLLIMLVYLLNNTRGRGNEIPTWQEFANLVERNSLKEDSIVIKDDRILAVAEKGALATNPEEASAMIPEAARLVAEEVAVLNRIVDAFSKFARLPEPQMVKTDLAGVTADVAGVYSSGDVEVNISGTEQSVHVKADPLLLKEALTNLIKNAAEAVGTEGSVSVAVRTTRGVGMISVTDTGPGFPPAFFDGGPRPYFTTKSDGTGLGLVVAQRIIDDMGGTLDLGNTNDGARVDVTFPVIN